MKPANLCLFRTARGRITLRSSAKYLDQLASSLIGLTHRNRYLLSRASQLRKGFAKLRGRATDDSLKLAIEIRHGLKSACEGNFANSRIGIEQKRLRFLHSNSREVIDEIHPGRFLEHLAEVMPADISHLGDPPERQRLRLMVLDKLARSRHICGLILFAPYSQLIRQDRKVFRKKTQEPQHRAVPDRR